MGFNRLNQILRPCSQLFTNSFWLFSSEFFAKLSRIFTIVVLTTNLTPVSYGTAMLSLAVHDMLAFMLRAGSGTQIIQCNSDDLCKYARNGATIQWIICLSISAIQYFSADLISILYDNHSISELLKFMAVIYLFYPLVSVRVFLLHRENYMRWFSIRSGLCTIIENISIAIFVIFGADIMAVAYGKLVFSLLWVFLFSFSPIKSYGLGFQLTIFKKLFKTSIQLSGSEFLRSLRVNTDTFIAGKLLTPELFGFYIFAKNAGIGISQSIGNVFNSALFPFLCKLQRNDTLDSNKRTVYLIALAVGLLFFVQALMVPIYVPIIFDTKWHSVIPVVSAMCLIALPTVIIDTFCMFKRAKSEYKSETKTRLYCVIITIFTLVVVAPTQPMSFAITLLIGSFISLLTLLINPLLLRKPYKSISPPLKERLL